MAGLPRQLRQRLWPKRLSIAIRRSFVQFEYDPGRPWYLIQSAADDQFNHQEEENCVFGPNETVCVYPKDKNVTIFDSSSESGNGESIVEQIRQTFEKLHRSDQAIPLA